MYKKTTGMLSGTAVMLNETNSILLLNPATEDQWALKRLPPWMQNFTFAVATVIGQALVSPI